MLRRNKKKEEMNENSEGISEQEYYYRAANDEIKKQIEQIKIDALKYWASQ